MSATASGTEERDSRGLRKTKRLRGLAPEKAGGTLGRKEWKWEEMKKEREESEREMGL